jgi:predicted transcriptional regulator of viral defense system
MKKSKTRTARVRAAAQRLKTFTVLDLVDIDSLKMVRITIRELFKRGELKRIAPGRYEYVDGKQPVAEVEQRILRAIWIRGLFRVKNIKILADAEANYIRRLVRRLISAGHVEHIGNFHKEKQYRVKNRDQFYLIYIRAAQALAPREGKRKCP